MQHLNTNPGTTSSATRRAQLVTEAVVAAYIQEISDGKPVSRVPAPSQLLPADEPGAPWMAHRRREPSRSRRPREHAKLTRPRRTESMRAGAAARMRAA